MPIPTNVFKNILRLEEHKGFTDSAVQGGLEAFARRWAEQVAASERAARPMADAIADTFLNYGVIEATGRESVVRTANELLALFDEGVRVVPGSPAKRGAVKNGASGNGHAS